MPKTVVFLGSVRLSFSYPGSGSTRFAQRPGGLPAMFLLLGFFACEYELTSPEVTDQFFGVSWINHRAEIPIDFLIFNIQTGWYVSGT